MIRQVMPEFHSKDHIIILCDSWYTKQNLVCPELSRSPRYVEYNYIRYAVLWDSGVFS